MGNLFSFIGRNWGILLIIFGLGGTAAVVSVIPKDVPGQEAVHTITQDQLEAAKLRVVSATDAQ